jgi:16S rRNA (guanine527-N7)-methyltransferase
MRDELITAIITNQGSFGLSLAEEAIDRIAAYYALIASHNAMLHLVAPMTPEEFAIRHILESLTMLRHLPIGSRFADIGSGAGLPAVPCLLVRPDLAAYLIESKEKKAEFLRKAAEECGLTGRATVICKQFSEVLKPPVGFVTCRALDKFTQKVPRIAKWAGKSKLLLFGGPALREALAACDLRFTEELMPLSEQRYLFIAG